MSGEVVGHVPDNSAPRRCKYCGQELRWAGGLWAAVGGKAMATYCFERAKTLP